MAAGLKALREAGAEYYVHCGDVGELPMLDQLAGLPSAFVWGNTDYERVGMQRYAETIGIRCLGGYGVLELDGKRVGVMHGDNGPLKRQVLDEQQVDYLLQGHTHVRADERVGKVRLINPGALHRASQKTVAILDLETGDLRFIVVEA